jgi:hypothetical protein
MFEHFFQHVEAPRRAWHPDFPIESLPDGDVGENGERRPAISDDIL